MTWAEVKAEAFGEIGLLPEQFYDLEHEDYFLLKKGFAKGRVFIKRTLRDMVQIVIAPWIKNSPSPYSLWPIEYDDELKKWDKERRSVVSEQAMALLREFKEKERNQKPKEN